MNAQELLSELTLKQRRFVEEYIIDFNGKQAAIRAGYSAKTAGEIAYENLNKPQISSVIKAIVDAKSEQLGLTADAVYRGVLRLLNSDPRKLYDEKGKLKPVTEWDDDTALSVSGIEVEEEIGEGTPPTRTCKVRFHSKTEPLRLGAQLLGLLEDKLRVTGSLVVVSIGGDASMDDL